MNQFFAAGATLVFTLVLLGLGRKPKNLFKKSFSQKLPANLEQIALVLPSTKTKRQDSEAKPNNFIFRLPTNPKEHFKLTQKLKSLISSNPEEKLLAIQIAEEWGDFSVIPVLKLGLRDMDSRIAKRAAKALSRFKGCPRKIVKKKSVSYPRNVFLMR